VPSRVEEASRVHARTAESTAHALARTLSDLGVRHLFGMDSPEALYASLGGSGIKAVTARDERAAAAMADGYARVSRQVGVCTGLHGAGATNLVQGLVEAWMASSAVVVLASELSRLTRDKNELQDIDHLPFFAPITKWAARIENPDRISEMTARGFRLAASGRPRPVYLGYPVDVLSTEARETPLVSVEKISYPLARVAADPASLERVAHAIAGAERPAILAGGGVLSSGAETELAQLAHLLKAPVATTPLGKGAFDESDALSVGVAGSYTGGAGGRGRIANETIREADLVIVVGSKTDSVATADWTVPSHASTIVHIDIDPAETQRNFAEAIPLVADAKLALEGLIDRLQETTPASAWPLDEIRFRVDSWEAAQHRADAASTRMISPSAIVRTLNEQIDQRAIVTTDASYSSAWALESLRLHRPGRRFLAPRGYGALGWGLPAAIGAKFAAPHSRVYCITGDGGFGYVFQELETAARYEIPVTVIVLNNAGLAFQRHYEERFWNRSGETAFLDVRYAEVAKAMGCHGVRIETIDAFADALREADRLQRPTVIDAVVDMDARPPLTMFDRA
jgi:acetolactate synthase I/II/III large subunit